MGKKNKNSTNYEITSQVRGWCKLSCKEATLITGKLTILNSSSELVVTRDYEGHFPVYFVTWNDKNIPRDKSLVTFIGCKNDENIVELTILD